MDSDIAPFRVAISDEALTDLGERLARARFADDLPGAGWDYGTPTAYLRPLVAYWRDEYDWRTREARLNTFDQFTTEIRGQRVHFVHVRSPEPDARPLVVTHGWPGSIVEFLDVIGPLTDPRAHGGEAASAFHVVAPSLPGYAFSGATHERGVHLGTIAELWAELMRRLGYDRYYAQGGDWGSFVTSMLARIDPEHCAGIHLNMLAPTGEGPPDAWSDDERAYMAQLTDQYMTDGAGYLRIQSTRPHSVGAGLDDSPVGLAAWILEKFRAWSDTDDIDRTFGRDRLLDNVMLYWLTTTATSSARTYFEFERAVRSGVLDIFGRVEVPTGYTVYPGEIMRTSRRWAERSYDLVYFNEQPRGGHFAAFEVPDLFVPDIRACFRSLA
jgi:pimeloyl-ACP methyl ester carboxylesterase